DAASRNTIFLWHRCPVAFLVQIFGRRIRRCPLRDDPLDLSIVGKVYVGRRHRKIEEVALTEHLALASRSQDNELVAKIAPDWTSIRAHRNGFQAKPRKGAQIGHEHTVISSLRTLIVEVEGVS